MDSQITSSDISFSSYLKFKDLDPTPNPQENGTNRTPDDTEISIFDARKYFNETNDPSDVKRLQPSLDSLDVPRLSSVSSVDRYCRNFQTRSFHATPTSSSEVSWNSQAGLLANSRGVSLIKFKASSNKRISTAKKWIFGRKCCCNSKKSVQIKEVTSVSEQRRPVVLINNEKTRRDYQHNENKPQNLSRKSSITNDIVEIRQNKVSLSPQSLSTLYQSSQCRISASGRPVIDGPIGFTFPILNPSSDKGIIRKSLVKPLDDPSMDNHNPVAKPIFKPLRDQSRDNHLAKAIFKPLKDQSMDDHIENSIFKPLEDQSVDNHIARPIFKPLEDKSMNNPVNRESPIARDDDTGSDSSSDLFEIESFSNQTTLYRRRDSLDEDHQYNARRFESINGIDNNTQCSGRNLEEEETPAPASVAATECYTPASDDGGKREGNNGVVLMSRREEKAVAVGPPPVAEGPLLSLNIGGGPPRADKTQLRSASQSAAAQLSLAFAA